MNRPFRIIEGLEWVRPATTAPWPKTMAKNLSKTQAAGLAYQRKVCSTIGVGAEGQWLEFCDANGPGYAQPDLVLRRAAGGLVAIEIKLTWTVWAAPQLTQLYIPLLRQLTDERVVGVIICKNLTPATPVGYVHGDLLPAVEAATSNIPSICHWAGRFPGQLAKRASVE